MDRICIDQFSAGLDDLNRKQQGDHVAVLRVLHRTGRFSCFEASENQTIARTMDYILHDGLIETTDNGYPWTGVKLTQKALDLIAETPIAEGEMSAQFDPDFYDHYKQPIIICPHCRHEMTDDEMGANHYAEGSDGDDLWALAPEERRTKVICPSVLCGKPYFVQGGYKPTYTTAATEGEIDLY